MFSMDTRRELTSHVANDYGYDERETSLHFMQSDDDFTIVTTVPAVARQLLEHDEAEIRWLYVRGQEHGRHVDDESELPENGRVSIQTVSASMPIGALSIKSSPRSSDSASNIVTTPADVEGLSEAFDDDD